MISIVTNTHDNIKTLPVLYDSLLHQSDREFEWIVTDDGSDDGTWDLIKAYVKEDKIPIEGYSQTNKGMRLSRSINAGLRRAKGNIIFVVFGDTFLHPDVIFDIKSDFKYGSAGCALRRNVNKNKEFVSWDWRIATNEDLLHRIIELGATPWKQLCGNGMLVERDALKSIGYWPEEYEGYGREDWCIYMRLKRMGLSMYMYNSIIINHFAHSEGKDNPSNVARFDKEEYENNLL